MYPQQLLGRNVVVMAKLVAQLIGVHRYAVNRKQRRKCYQAGIRLAHQREPWRRPFFFMIPPDSKSSRTGNRPLLKYTHNQNRIHFGYFIFMIERYVPEISRFIY